MPKFTTEKRTEHILALTDTELAALREAARFVLVAQPDHEHAETWKTFSRLGLSATRSQADTLQADRVTRGFAEE